MELTAFIIKFIMTAAATLVTQLKWLATIESAAALWLLWLYIRWVSLGQSLGNSLRH